MLSKQSFRVPSISRLSTAPQRRPPSAGCRARAHRRLANGPRLRRAMNAYPVRSPLSCPLGTCSMRLLRYVCRFDKILPCAPDSGVIPLCSAVLAALYWQILHWLGKIVVCPFISICDTLSTMFSSISGGTSAILLHLAAAEMPAAETLRRRAQTPVRTGSLTGAHAGLTAPAPSATDLPPSAFHHTRPGSPAWGSCEPGKEKPIRKNSSSSRRQLSRGKVQQALRAAPGNRCGGPPPRSDFGPRGIWAGAVRQ